MVWQDVFPVSVSRRDAEEERELRLAAQARAGADWAFAALVARYQPPVTRYLTRLTGNPVLARTLAERIFVRMERRVRGPQGGVHLRLWVLRACTEAGLDAVRQPRHTSFAARLEGPRPTALLTGQPGHAATEKLRSGFGALANLTGTTRRQMRKLIWSGPESNGFGGAVDDAASHPAYQAKANAEAAQTVEEMEHMDPRDALRYRMVRAVLAELPYGDAQCLALHLVAGLNQAEVAHALGITHSATRKRIVHGLQLFSQRYEAAAVSLGLPAEALAPTTDPAAGPSTTFAGIGDSEDALDIAEQPTLDLGRPTVVTGSIAAVSPVIRTADPAEDTAAPAAASTRSETGVPENEAHGAVERAELEHTYPEVAEVVAIAAADGADTTDAAEVDMATGDERDRPFVVMLATEAVELAAPAEETVETTYKLPPVLPAPVMAPPSLDVRIVPVLSAAESVDVSPVAQADAMCTLSAARLVPVLTVADVLAEAEDAADASVESTPVTTSAVARDGATTTKLTAPRPAAAVRRVPVVTPAVDVAETAGGTLPAGVVRRLPQVDEDSIATRPLPGRNGGNLGGAAITNGQDIAGGRQSAGAPERPHERMSEDGRMAVAAVPSDDASADI